MRWGVTFQILAVFSFALSTPQSSADWTETLSTCARRLIEPWAPSLCPPPAEQVEQFRVGSSSKRLELIREAESAFRAAVTNRIGHSEVGFHFNLHGGTAESFVAEGGVRFTTNTPESYIQSRDMIPSRESLENVLRLYFFNSRFHSPYEVLDARPSFTQSRYGSVLVLFDLRAVERRHGENILDENAISFKFSPNSQGKAVPLSAFVIEPLSVFDEARRLTGGRIGSTRSETTYAALLALTKAISTE